MAVFSCAPTPRSSDSSSPLSWFRAILVFATFGLGGCNANQTLNASGQTDLNKTYYPNYNAYDPTKYGQTSGFYAGR